MVLIGNIQGRKDGKTHRIDGVRRLGNGAHFGVNVLRELEDVIGIGAAQVVGLIENFHPDAGVLRVFDNWIFRRCRHPLASTKGMGKLARLGQRFDLRQHLLDSAANVFPLFL